MFTNIPMLKELYMWYNMTTKNSDIDIKPSILINNVKNILSSEFYLKDTGFRYILISKNKADNYILNDIFQENKEIRKITDWAKNNIIFKLKDINIQSVEVLLKVFEGMLHKTKISNDTKWLIHQTVCYNTYRSHYIILCEDLPF